MASSNSKHLLLQTQNNISPLLMIFIFSLLLLNNVNSQSYFPPVGSLLGSPAPAPSPQPSPDTMSFNFPVFLPEDSKYLSLMGDASIARGILHLTKTDNLGNPTQYSIGRAQYKEPVHLWDKTTGKLANFCTKFTFLIDPKGAALHADGFAFFLAPAYSTIPVNSTGGYLGLFNPQTAINNTNLNQIVAIEFDTYVNEWDPPVSNHIGFDINSISSSWPELDKGIVYANIHYDSNSKMLSVSALSENNSTNYLVMSQVVDLRSVLPEWVSVGFSVLPVSWLKHTTLFHGVSRQLCKWIKIYFPEGKYDRCQ